MWQVAAGASVGTSHRLNDTPCQDAFRAESLDMPDGTVGLMVFVADGAGSAALSRIGARIAVDGAIVFTDVFSEENADRAAAAFDRTFVSALVVYIRDALAKLADTAGVALRDLACTLLGAIALKDRTVVFQIGDGAIVFDDGSGLSLAIPPMSGEYINMTHFVVDEDVFDHLAVRESGPVSRLAVFSDGLQRLALNLATGEPHVPFFEPFFKALENADPHQGAAFDAALIRFLDSESVNERTDDDKTLVLALRRS